MMRVLKFIAECIAAFVGVVIVLALLLVWRLSAKPVSSDFLTPYIEAGIESILPDSTVTVAGTVLAWDNADHSISLHADTIKVADRNGGDVALIPTLNARISVIGLLFGQLMPKDLSIDHPQIQVTREANGDLVFGGRTVGAAQAKPDQSEEPIRPVLKSLFDRLTHAVLMHQLAVTHAVFDVRDAATQKIWTVGIPEISIKRIGLVDLHDDLQIGSLEGRVTIEITQKEGIASVDVHYLYDPRLRRHRLSSVFADVTPAFLAGGHPETLGLGAASAIALPLTGKVEVAFDQALAIENVAAQIHGGAGQLVYADFWDKPLPVTTMDFSGDYDRAAHSLKISDTHIDLDGTTLDFDLDGTAPTQPGHDLDFASSLRVDNMPMNRYADLWPKPMLSDPRYWLASNLRDGVFAHAEVSLKGALAWNDLANLSVTEGDGKISAKGGRVTYLDGMPPAENVGAEASFDLKKMNVQITGGGIGAIAMKPFVIEITGLADPDQDIHIPLQVAGPVPDILRLLDHPPLGYAKALGLSPDDLQGRLEGSIDFRFPLLKTLLMKDVKIQATANATGIASTRLVPGIAIDQGNFALTLTMDGFGMKGQAALDKVPFQIGWQEAFEAQRGKPLRHITVAGAVRDDQWHNFGINAFDGSKGSVGVTLDVTKPDKKNMRVTGALDMTQAALQVDALGWKKPVNASATLKFTANAPRDENIEVTSIELRGDHVRASGDGELSSDASQLLSLDLAPLIVGRTNTTLHFSQSFGESGALEFTAKGEALDISGLRGGNDPARADTRPKKYNIQVDRLYAGSVGEIDQAKGFAARDQQGWREISLHGMAQGTTPLSIDLTQQPDGHRTFAVASDDFGKAMLGLGFTDTIKGGKLSITGQSTVDNPRLITGRAKISAFTVEKLPVLMLLLNATSPFGFTGILTDSADFSRFEGDYHWQNDTITLTKAHAAGSAVGINIDGKVDMNSGEANLQGTVVPFSVVNKMLNYIPLIGDLITGGEDQGVLAVAYDITGPLASPKISVNPVSLLTPGFIRNLFFRDDAADDN